MVDTPEDGAIPRTGADLEAMQSQPEAQETPSPSVTEDGASSSDAADQDQEPEGAAEAVRDAFLKEYGDPTEMEEPDAGTPDPAASQASTDPAQNQPDNEIPEADEADADTRIPDEEFKALTPGVKKRFGILTSRAHKAEKQIAEYEAQLHEATPAVERMQQFNKFVTENNIDHENMAQAMAASAELAQGNAEGFLRRIAPFVDYARQMLGHVTDPALREQVEQGYMTEEAAQELTRTRSEAARSKGEAQRAAQQAEAVQQEQVQRQQMGQRTAAIQHIAQMVDSRERELMSDPDYARLQPDVHARMKFAIDGGARPQNAEQAVQMVNDAFAQAKAVSPRQVKPSTHPSPNSSAPKHGSAVPRSLEEALTLEFNSGP